MDTFLVFLCRLVRHSTFMFFKYIVIIDRGRFKTYPDVLTQIGVLGEAGKVGSREWEAAGAGLWIMEVGVEPF